MKKILLCVAVASLLGACGGGGSDGAAAPTTPTPNQPVLQVNAKGIYQGTTSTGSSVAGLVESNGKFWFLYTEPSSSSAAGFLQGDIIVNGNNISSTNAKDFNLPTNTATPVTVSGAVAQGRSFNGNVQYTPSSVVAFNTLFDSTASTYKASNSDTKGTFTGTVGILGAVESASISFTQIGGDGNSAATFTARGASGCTLSGTTQLASGATYFNMQAVFGGSPCLLARQSMTGVAVYDPATKTLRIAGVNGSREQGLLFIGRKP